MINKIIKFERSIIFALVITASNFTVSSTLFGVLDNELQDAVRRCDKVEFIKLLQQGATPDAPESQLMIGQGWTPLIHAINTQPPSIMKFFVGALIKARANPLAEDFLNQNAVYHARRRLHEIVESAQECFCCIYETRRKEVRDMNEIINFLKSQMEKAQGKISEANGEIAEEKTINK